MSPLPLDSEVTIQEPYDALEGCLKFEDAITHKQYYIAFDEPNPTLKETNPIY